MRWLQQNGLLVDHEGFEQDAGRADLTIGGRPVEVMTAQMDHRDKTGFCVPPGKLGAAERRGAWGYLFVGSGSEPEPTTLYIQAACPLDQVALDEPRLTWVSRPENGVLNYVIRPEVLLSPEDFLRILRGAL